MHERLTRHARKPSYGHKMANLEDTDVRELARAVSDDPALVSVFVREYRGPGRALDSLTELVEGKTRAATQVRETELGRLVFSRPDAFNLEKQEAAARKLADLYEERRDAAAEFRRALIAALRSPEDLAPEVRRPRPGSVGVLVITLVGIIGVTLAALLLEPPSLSFSIDPKRLMR